MLDHAHAEIQKSIAAGLIDPAAATPEAGGLALGRLWMRLTLAQRDELHGRMKALQMEYAAQQAPADDPTARYYEFLLGIYPTIAPPARG